MRISDWSSDVCSSDLALTRQLGIADRVQFRGFVERHADVLQTVAASDVFASASQVEGFGIVLVEAMALGVPYVATDIPAHREVTGAIGRASCRERVCQDV